MTRLKVSARDFLPLLIAPDLAKPDAAKPHNAVIFLPSHPPEPHHDAFLPKTPLAERPAALFAPEEPV
ncbi:MAG: hypothetical protein LBB51_04120, partial [Zoogloeaceae bacterium]|nr:hypothetical protein [Zoogloeaceae bacterium]